MNDREEGRILGRLEEGFKQLNSRLVSLEQEVKDLNKFKMKVTLIMAGILGTIELVFRVYSSMH